MNKYKKPPLGVMPHKIWIELRIKDLQRAIIDYAAEGMPVKPEWVNELRELETKLLLLNCEWLDSDNCDLARFKGACNNSDCSKYQDKFKGVVLNG